MSNKIIPIIAFLITVPLVSSLGWLLVPKYAIEITAGAIVGGLFQVYKNWNQ